jgi:hypothetical protein
MQGRIILSESVVREPRQRLQEMVRRAPGEADPLSGNGQDLDYPMIMPVERPHLPWHIPGVGRL